MNSLRCPYCQKDFTVEKQRWFLLPQSTGLHVKGCLLDSLPMASGAKNNTRQESNA